MFCRLLDVVQKIWKKELNKLVQSIEDCMEHLQNHSNRCCNIHGVSKWAITSNKTFCMVSMDISANVSDISNWVFAKQTEILHID